MPKGFRTTKYVFPPAQEEKRPGCSRSRSHRAGFLGGKRDVLAPASRTPTECSAPPSARLPTRQAGRTRGSWGGKARAHPAPHQAAGSAPYRTPARARWCCRQRGRGATARDARPWRRLSRPPVSSRQPAPAPACSAGGDRPTRAEVAEKEARASAGRTDRHTGQWEAGIWREAWLRPSPAPRLGSFGRHLPAPGSCCEVARTSSCAAPTAGGGMCFGRAGWYPVP